MAAMVRFLGLICVLVFLGCKQNPQLAQKELVATKTMNKDYPGYYIQINNQNCHYELRTNDF